ncbi:DUF445 family protein [Clostridium sp. DL1XJH146]
MTKEVMLRVLFTAVVGSIIGYITNWLAIKMLFRPYEEKRIFGFKVPFTPGLIPKEKDRIAKSVGEAIGEHLLTSETIVESLCSDEMNGKLRTWVKDKVEVVEKKGASIGEEIKVFLGDKYEKLVVNLEDKTSGYIINQLKNTEVRNDLISNIMDTVNEKLQFSTKDFIESGFYKDFRIKMLNKIIKLKDSDELAESINKSIVKKIDDFSEDGKRLNDVIPTEIIGSVKVYIYNNSESISTEIDKFIQEDSVKEKIRETISKLISSNINPMIAMFVNPDSINEKVMTSLSAQLKDENTQKDIALILNKVIDKIIESEVKNIKDGFGESLYRSINTVTKAIMENIFKENSINEMMEIFEKNILATETLKELIDSFDEDIIAKVKRILDAEIIKLANSEEFSNKVKEYVEQVVDKLLSYKLKDISINSSRSLSDSSADFVQIVYDRFVENSAVDFIEAFEIRKIVEDKINSFEVSYAEDIILEIASKELGAITWLGALLGCIMGLLSAVVSYI